MKVHSFGCYRQRHNAQAMPEVLASFDQNQHCLVCDQEVLVEPAQRKSPSTPWRLGTRRMRLTVPLTLPLAMMMRRKI
jgi:hypothetical protein